MSFKKSDRVRVKYFAERPKHWNEKGLMDKYMGQEVTINVNKYSHNYYAEGWVWRESDFEEDDFLSDKDLLI